MVFDSLVPLVQLLWDAFRNLINVFRSSSLMRRKFQLPTLGPMNTSIFPSAIIKNLIYLTVYCCAADLPPPPAPKEPAIPDGTLLIIETNFRRTGWLRPLMQIGRRTAADPGCGNIGVCSKLLSLIFWFSRSLLFPKSTTKISLYFFVWNFGRFMVYL